MTIFHDKEVPSVGQSLAESMMCSTNIKYEEKQQELVRRLVEII